MLCLEKGESEMWDECPDSRLGHSGLRVDQPRPLTRPRLRLTASSWSVARNGPRVLHISVTLSRDLRDTSHNSHSSGSDSEHLDTARSFPPEPWEYGAGARITRTPSERQFCSPQSSLSCCHHFQSAPWDPSLISDMGETVIETYTGRDFVE